MFQQWGRIWSLDSRIKNSARTGGKCCNQRWFRVGSETINKRVQMHKWKLNQVFCVCPFFLIKFWFCQYSTCASNWKSSGKWLAQVASWYKVSKEKLNELIEIKEKLIRNDYPSTKLSMAKLVGAEG